jgi:putative SOS response-associated peptidase YedK
MAVAPDHGREFAGTVAHPVGPEATFVIGSAVYLFSHRGHMVPGMCNDYRSHVDLDTMRQDFSEIRIGIRFPEGVPNLQPRDDIRLTDMAPIVRADGEPGTADLVQRRWSWPERGRPVYNFRSENREFTNGRCLIVADGFYEFTPHTDPKSKRKHKWLFSKTDEPWFCIAGIWRTTEVGEAFTMLTTEPGPDVAPYHDRQVAVLDRADWARWLDPSVSAKTILKPLPLGRLKVQQVA